MRCVISNLVARSGSCSSAVTPKRWPIRDTPTIFRYFAADALTRAAVNYVSSTNSYCTNRVRRTMKSLSRFFAMAALSTDTVLAQAGTIVINSCIYPIYYKTDYNSPSVILSRIWRCHALRHPRYDEHSAAQSHWTSME